MVTRYVYRTVRSAGRVQRTYLGTLADPVVQSLERFKQLEQVTADAEAAKVDADLELLERVDACLALLKTTTGRIIRNLRKRYDRGHHQRIPRCTLPDVKITRDDYDQVVADAADGSEDALAVLRRVLRANPALYHELGDLNAHVRRHLINMSAAAIDTQEAMQLMLADQRQELLAGGDSLPERLLIEQILTTMLDAACCQIGLAQPHRKESVRQRWERQLQRAQARHQVAICSLTEVRQMLEATTPQPGGIEMTRSSGKYAAQLRAIEQLRIVTMQESKLELLAQLRLRLDGFWQPCSAAREAFMNGERRLSIHEARFRELTAALANALLQYVPDEYREQLHGATRTSAISMAAQWERRLGNIEIIALADLELKILLAAVVEVMSQPYTGEVRLPAWGHSIDEANAEIQAACDGWQRLADVM